MLGRSPELFPRPGGGGLMGSAWEPGWLKCLGY